MRRSHLTVPVAVACLALSMAGSADGASTSTAFPQAQSASDAAPLIRTLSDVDGPIAPGWYFLPLSGRTGSPYGAAVPSPLRAIVRISAGYSTDDGHVITGPGENGSTLAVASDVSRVDTEPCGGGRLIDPGPTVQDLTDALATHASAGPRSVSVDASEGFHLEFATPDEIAQCPGSIYRVLADQAEKTPGTYHLWVLDVEGHRVVVTVRQSAGESDQLVTLAESLMFVHQRAPH